MHFHGTSAWRPRECYQEEHSGKVSINGYENWLPAHNDCNQRKSSTPFDFAPIYRPIFERLLQQAARVERTANSIKFDAAKDKILGRLLVALDEGEVSPIEVSDILNTFGVVSVNQERDYVKIGRAHV